MPPLDPELVHEEFFHVRVLIGIVTGLSITRLLTGLARFVQHPSRTQIYPVHLAWVFYLLLAVMDFWWFEFGLGHRLWSAGPYFFVIGYAALYFFICALLFPDQMGEYTGFADYFHARQAWFYGLLAAVFLADMADTALKGAEHFRFLGPLYPLRQLALAAFAIIAACVRDRRFHAAFVALALAAEVWSILRHFDLPPASQP
jgi:hypothetical protein